MAKIDEKLQTMRLSMSEIEKIKANKAITALRLAVNINIDVNKPKNLLTIASLVRDYPELDIAKEIRDADHWLDTRKDKRNYMRFITNWCSNGSRYQREREAKYVDRVPS